MTAMPRAWTTSRLADIADVRLGRQRSPKNATGDRMRPYLRAANVKWGGLELSDVNEMAFTEAESETYELRLGDLLLGEASGSPSEVGKPGQYKGEIDGCCFQNTLLRVRLPNGLLPDFYEHYFREQALNGKFAAGSRGVGIHHLGASALSDWLIPVAPTAEQERIVTAIEEAFSKLDAGEAGLRTVRLLLKRMREAVLAAAVTGRLFPPDSDDSSASRAVDDSDLPADLDRLPPGWIWATTQSLAKDERNAVAIGPFGSDLKVDDYRDAGVPLVFVRNIRKRDFASGAKFVSHEKAAELSAHLVRPGEVLVTKMGDPPGDAAVYRQTASAVITADCIKITPGSAILADFLALAISTGETQRRLRGLTSGVAQQKITLAGFRKLPVPVPPLHEQLRIVDEVARQVSFIESCERTVAVGLDRSAALRRAVLKAAFDGTLVPQDPANEPASVILERIRAGRSESDGSRGGRRRNKVGHRE